MRTLRLAFLVAAFFAPLITHAQEPKYVYCQIVANEKLLSKKITVSLDFGQKMKFFADNRLKDENGKPIVFNSNVDAMNYMGKQGWEFCQLSMVEVTSGSADLVQVTVMKKLFSDLDEEAKKEYLKE